MWSAAEAFFECLAEFGQHTGVGFEPHQLAIESSRHMVSPGIMKFDCVDYVYESGRAAGRA